MCSSRRPQVLSPTSSPIPELHEPPPRAVALSRSQASRTSCETVIREGDSSRLGAALTGSDYFDRSFREPAFHEYLNHPVPVVPLEQHDTVLHGPPRGEHLLHLCTELEQVLLVHLQAFDYCGRLPEPSHLHPDLHPRLFAVELRYDVVKAFF